MDRSGEVAVVTGAASGIRRAVAGLLGQRGAAVIAADIREDTARPKGAGPPSKGAGAHFVATDVTEVKQVRALFSDTVSRYGKVDTLVNCAGICRCTPIPEITPEEWDEVLSVNLRSTFLCSQEALRSMCARRHGRIVNVASAAATTVGAAVGAHYAASKAGVICLTKSLALYAAPYEVTVNCVCPGPIVTPMTDAWGEETNTAFAGKIPLGRYGSPEEAAEAICFLCSDQAKYITGETLDVNGGLVMD